MVMLVSRTSEMERNDAVISGNCRVAAGSIHHKTKGYICQQDDGSNNRETVFTARFLHYSAKRGLLIACLPSVRPSVCLSVCDVGWKS